MKIVACALAALTLAACASVQPVPIARPLNPAQIAAIGPTSVAVTENNDGVTKSWVAQNFAAAGASQGVLGVLVGAAMDGIANYAPSHRAGRTADELAQVMPATEANRSMVDHFRQQAVTINSGSAVTVSDVRAVQKLIDDKPVDDAVEVATAYVLSEDGTTLQVTVTVTYANAAVPYVTPYVFEGAPPKSELTGPVYRNTFTYRSSQLPVPVLTSDMKERLVASINESARDENGALPADGSDAQKAMVAELAAARDNEFTRGEISIFLAREWTRDDGALLQRTIDEAHAFVAKYVVLDMNRIAVPSLTGTDEIIETLADGRTVRRIGAGFSTGSYVSLPGNVSDFVTFGNANAVARVNRNRIEAIRAEARIKPARS